MKSVQYIPCILLFLILFQCKKESTPVPTVTIAALPAIAEYGKTTTLSWTSENASSCTIDGKEVGISGTLITPPLTAKTTYNIIAKGNGRSISSSVDVNVGPGVYTSFNDLTVDYGGKFSLSFEAYNSTSVFINGQQSAQSGIFAMQNMARDTTITLKVFGWGGSITKTVSIKVGDWKLTNKGLLTHDYWLLQSLKFFQNGILISTSVLHEEDKTDKYYFYLNGDYKIFHATGTQFGSGQWYFSDNVTITFVGSQIYNITSLTTNEFIKNEPADYNGKPAISQQAYWRP